MNGASESNAGSLFLSLLEDVHAEYVEVMNIYECKELNPSFSRREPIKDEPITCMNDLLMSVFPIASQEQHIYVDCVSFRYDAPSFREEECLAQGVTYGVVWRAVIRVYVFAIDDTTQIEDVVEQELFFGEIPLFSGRGSWILDGKEYVAPWREPSAARTHYGHSFLTALHKGFRKMATTIAKRIEKGSKKQQEDPLSAYDLMPHDLISAGPLHTAIRNWSRQMLVPLTPGNPAARLASLAAASPKPPQPPPGLAAASLAVPLVAASAPSLPKQWEQAALRGAPEHVCAPVEGALCAISDDFLLVMPDLPETLTPDTISWPVKVPMVRQDQTCAHAFSQRPIVALGERVQRHEPLALAIGASGDGLALGREATVAFVPADVLCASMKMKTPHALVADEVTSEALFASWQLHQIPYEIDARVKPRDAASVDVRSYDEWGVITAGCQVKAGDVLVQEIEPGRPLLAPEPGLGVVRGVLPHSRQHERWAEAPLVVAAKESIQTLTKESLRCFEEQTREGLVATLKGHTLLRKFVYEGEGEMRVLPKDTVLTRELLDGWGVARLFEVCACLADDSTFESWKLERACEDQRYFLMESSEAAKKHWNMPEKLPKKLQERGLISLLYQRPLQEGDTLLTRQGVAAPVKLALEEEAQSNKGYWFKELNALSGESVEVILPVDALASLPPALHQEAPALKQHHELVLPWNQSSATITVGRVYLMKSTM